MIVRLFVALFLITATSQAVAQNLPETLKKGRTEIYGKPCDISIKDSNITVQEYKLNYSSGNFKVVQRIQFKNLTNRYDGFREENGQPYTTFFFEQRQGLNNIKQQIWIYYTEQKDIDWAMAIQEVRPTFGSTQTAMITCLF